MVGALVETYPVSYLIQPLTISNQILALQANFLLNFLLTSFIGKLYAVKFERIVVCFFFPLFSVVISKGATITTFFSIKFDKFF